jgi:hypothetical protein
MGRSDSDLKPRNGHTLNDGIIARISGCVNQKELSLDDQVDHAKEVVAEMYDGLVFRQSPEYGVGLIEGIWETFANKEVSH